MEPLGGVALLCLRQLFRDERGDWPDVLFVEREDLGAAAVLQCREGFIKMHVAVGERFERLSVGWGVHDVDLLAPVRAHLRPEEGAAPDREVEPALQGAYGLLRAGAPSHKAGERAGEGGVSGELAFREEARRTVLEVLREEEVEADDELLRRLDLGQYSGEELVGNGRRQGGVREASRRFARRELHVVVFLPRQRTGMPFTPRHATRSLREDAQVQTGMSSALRMT